MARELTSVADAHQRAKRRLPRSVYVYVEGGREAGNTRQRNLDAFGAIRFNPRNGVHHPRRDLTTTIFGREISMPMAISPTGFVRLAHPDGEVANARAAQAMNIPCGISTLSSHPLEDICKASDNVWFQLYMIGGREGSAEMIERAEKAGASALIVTIDRPAASGQDWFVRPVPDRIDLRTAIAYAPEMVTKPGWLFDFLKGGFELRVPNLPSNRSGKPMSLAEGAASLSVTPPTWEDIRWMRERWKKPLIVKGILSAADALRALDCGADAISVSNHGGNCLDSLPASIEVLPEVVAAVQGRMEVFLDSGVRRGADVAKALALGAKLTLIGRPTIWGLANGGEEGVRQVLGIFRSGMDATLALLGCPAMRDLDASYLRLPRSFDEPLLRAP